MGSRPRRSWPFYLEVIFISFRGPKVLNDRLRHHDRDMGMEEVLTAPRDPPGKIPLRNDCWAPSGASAWTTLWCGMRDRCGERCTTILPTSAVPYAFSLGQRRPGVQGSGVAGTGARGSAIPQVGGLHHRYQRRAAWPEQAGCLDGCLPERKCRFSLIYATKLLLIKTGFFRDTNSLHLDALDDWTRPRLPVFRLRCACQQGKCID
jgi:hypothetical protein